MEERLTKKERREQRKLEDLQKMEGKNNNSSMVKWIVIGLASVLFLGFFIFAVVISKKKASVPVALSSSGWVTGNPKSRVVFTEFGDFQCPACGAFEPDFAQIVKNYGKKVKIVFKHFPLKSAHPNAMAAAVAAEAAGKQEKFWEYHNLLYAKQNEWSALSDPTDTFVTYAKSLKLDSGRFKKDLNDKALVSKIEGELNEGIRVGVNSTPTVIINGVIMRNRDYNFLKKEIDKYLNLKK